QFKRARGKRRRLLRKMGSFIRLLTQSIWETGIVRAVRQADQGDRAGHDEPRRVLRQIGEGSGRPELRRHSESSVKTSGLIHLALRPRLMSDKLQLRGESPPPVQRRRTTIPFRASEGRA